MKFRHFLNLVANTKLSESSKFVIGNSSADYDSFFGSLIYAFLLTTTKGAIFMPLIDCEPAEINLRFEIAFVLEKLKIDQSIFKFTKDVKDFSSPAYEFCLYDHNRRDECFKILEIVDHHDYEQNKLRCQKYLINRMGSGLTLLYYLSNAAYFQQIRKFQDVSSEDAIFINKFLHFASPLSSSEIINNVDQDIDEIIRYGILLDTFNLDVEQQARWTTFDRLALLNIQKNRQFHVNYQHLRDLKFDHHRNLQLTFQQMRTKDYKKLTYNLVTSKGLTEIAFDYSILYIRPDIFFQKFEQELKAKQYKSEAEVEIFMSIFIGKEGKTQRELIFRGNDQSENKISILLQTYFLKNEFQLMGQLGNWIWFKDPSAIVSRKSLDKSLRKYFESPLPDL